MIDPTGRTVVALTLDQVADLLQVSRPTVDRLVRAGRLSTIRIGTGRGHPRVTERALAAYVASLEGRRRR